MFNDSIAAAGWKGDKVSTVHEQALARSKFLSDATGNSNSTPASFSRNDQAAQPTNGVASIDGSDPSGSRFVKLRTTTRKLADICCAKPTPTFDVLRPAIPILANIIQTAQDEQVLGDVCAAFFALSDGMSDQIQVILDTGVAQRLVQLLRHDCKRLVSC